MIWISESQIQFAINADLYFQKQNYSEGAAKIAAGLRLA